MCLNRVVRNGGCEMGKQYFVWRTRKMFGPTISDEEPALIASHYMHLHHVYPWWLWWLLHVHHPCWELNLLAKECATYTFSVPSVSCTFPLSFPVLFAVCVLFDIHMVEGCVVCTCPYEACPYSKLSKFHWGASPVATWFLQLCFRVESQPRPHNTWNNCYACI